jgi:hypothetical protein
MLCDCLLAIGVGYFSCLVPAQSVARIVSRDTSKPQAGEHETIVDIEACNGMLCVIKSQIELVGTYASDHKARHAAIT